MTDYQWKAFSDFKSEMKVLCEKWSQKSVELQKLQKEAVENALLKAKKDPVMDYNLELAVVYNTDYDKITKNDDIKMIVIGDNPGKEEQLFKNNRYLCGQSGRLAYGFFKKNPELDTDFYKNAIIINKTPVHTAKTNQLKYLYKNGSDEIKKIIDESQEKMAYLAAKLHCELIKGTDSENLPELWLVGYSELKNKGLFVKYRDRLKSEYNGTECWDKVFVYQHFSMNRFTIDLGEYSKKNKENSVKQNLIELGHLHRDEIFV